MAEVPFVGETGTFWRTPSLGGVPLTEDSHDPAPTVSYVLHHNGASYASGEAVYVDGRWEVEVTLPDTPGLVTMYWTFTAGAAVGKKTDSIKVQGFN